ncbi:hypothetical protein D3C71_1999020 [compost metagenome]
MRVLNQAAMAYRRPITQMAASDGVSMGVSISGRSNDSSQLDTCTPTSCPPSSTPRMMEVIVSPSIQPLARTNWLGGSSSVRMPYLAGE